MGRTVRTLAIAAVTLAMAGPVMAASGLTVELNHSRRIMLPGAAANVIVSNPAVADATVVDSHSIVLLGRGYGAAEVMVTDHAGRVLLDSDVNVVAPDRDVVTVHYGPSAVDFSCAPRCQPVASKDAGGAPNARSPSP
jgi:Flp pilus assembly secretin CpaC